MLLSEQIKEMSDQNQPRSDIMSSVYFKHRSNIIVNYNRSHTLVTPGSFMLMSKSLLTVPNPLADEPNNIN